MCAMKVDTCHSYSCHCCMMLQFTQHSSSSLLLHDGEHIAASDNNNSYDCGMSLVVLGHTLHVSAVLPIVYGHLNFPIGSSVRLQKLYLRRDAASNTRVIDTVEFLFMCFLTVVMSRHCTLQQKFTCAVPLLSKCQMHAVFTHHAGKKT